MDTTIPTRIRLSPATLAALKVRADAERRSITVMAGMLIEEALARPRLAHSAPMMPAKVERPTQVETFFRTPKRKRKS